MLLVTNRSSLLAAIPFRVHYFDKMNDVISRLDWAYVYAHIIEILREGRLVQKYYTPKLHQNFVYATKNKNVKTSFSVLNIMNFAGMLADIVTRWPGSTHDSHICQTDSKYRVIEIVT